MFCNVRFHYCAGIGFALIVCSILLLEHSALDIYISQFFYHNGQWIIAKNAPLPRWFFYTGIKFALIGGEIFILCLLCQRLLLPQKMPRFFQQFSSRELSYLVAMLCLVPAVIGLLKTLTHVPCPNHIETFGGQFPYLSLWQNTLSHHHEKCFPAAHAGLGFSWYAWAFLPRLRSQHFKIALAVTALGWIMGLYKMAIGDHFFSHTVISMLIAWTLNALSAAVLWHKS